MLVVMRGALGADRTLGHLDDDVGAGGVDLRNVVGRDPLLVLALAAGPLDRLDARVERRGDRVPVVEKGVLIEADVDEHRLQARFEVLHPALVDAARDLAVAVALDGELLEPAAFQESDPFFEPLA